MVSFTSVVGATHRQATYRVTILNLAEGQPLTPPLLATHWRGYDVFTVGQKASNGVRQIAENGNLDPLVNRLNNARRVSDVVVGSEPLVPLDSPGNLVHGFGNTWTTTITASVRATRLSWISMIICTNDGFTGVDSLRLPRAIGGTKARYTAGYDAGTERNTEKFADIVPPCQGLIGVTGDPGTGESNPALATNGKIHHHRGISGKADLMPAVHGWTDPVGLIVVQRIS
jgi:hypothetical protein